MDAQQLRHMLKVFPGYATMGIVPLHLMLSKKSHLSFVVKSYLVSGDRDRFLRLLNNTSQSNYELRGNGRRHETHNCQVGVCGFEVHIKKKQMSNKHKKASQSSQAQLHVRFSICPSIQGQKTCDCHVNVRAIEPYVEKRNKQQAGKRFTDLRKCTCFLDQYQVRNPLWHVRLFFCSSGHPYHRSHKTGEVKLSSRVRHSKRQTIFD